MPFGKLVAVVKVLKTGCSAFWLVEALAEVVWLAEIVVEEEAPFSASIRALFDLVIRSMFVGLLIARIDFIYRSGSIKEENHTVAKNLCGVMVDVDVVDILQPNASKGIEY